MYHRSIDLVLEHVFYGECNMKKTSNSGEFWHLIAALKWGQHLLFLLINLCAQSAQCDVTGTSLVP